MPSHHLNENNLFLLFMFCFDVRLLKTSEGFCSIRRVFGQIESTQSVFQTPSTRSGYFEIINFFFAYSPSVHTYPANPQFFNRLSRVEDLNALRIWNREVRSNPPGYFRNPMTLQTRIQSLPRKYLTWPLNEMPRLIAHALLTIFTKESWTLQRIRIRVDEQIRFEYVTCGPEHFCIRREKVVD